MKSQWMLAAMVGVIGLCNCAGGADKSTSLVICCRAENDLFRALCAGGVAATRVEDVAAAMDATPSSGTLLVLADDYPEKRVALPPDFFKTAGQRSVRVFVEYPEAAPGLENRDTISTTWERVVVASDALGSKLPKHSILALHECRLIPAKADDPLLVVARVAGYDRAPYGIPASAAPLLYRVPGQDAWIATSCLSNFVTGRYAPAERWRDLWMVLLKQLAPGGEPLLKFEQVVRPSFSKTAQLSTGYERESFTRAAKWVVNSGLINTPERFDEIMRLGAKESECTQPVAKVFGDGASGVQEGYGSAILHDGRQAQRAPIRADCVAEIAMMLALDGKLNSSDRSRTIASNLLKFLYVTSDLHGAERGDSKHPAFGLIMWGLNSPPWRIQNYGDDNARVMLATILAAAALDSDAWNKSLTRALLANLRTTGKLGFRPDSIAIADLEKNGWKHYHDSELINYAPHFESYLWACNLWAYRQTGIAEFRDRTKTAIKMTMGAYPDQWRFKDMAERSRMLLCLAWLVRVEDTPEHRAWMMRIADDLIAQQQPCGAIAERLAGTGGGHYQIPQTNEAYGTGETPLIQQNGDPASDQLYATPFALLALHEAATATGDPKLRQAEDRLMEYLCRIQTRSDKFPEFDGTWYRAFDFEKWDYWASSADMGWGAWCIEAGWGGSWATAVLGLRAEGKSLWDYSAGVDIKSHIAAVQQEMDQNDGGPLAAK